MYLKQQMFLVLGLSRSGSAAAEFLLSQKASVYVYDDIESDRVEQTGQALENKGARRIKKGEIDKMGMIEFRNQLLEKYATLKEKEKKEKSKIMGALYRDEMRKIEKVFLKNFKKPIDN